MRLLDEHAVNKMLNKIEVTEKRWNNQPKSE